MALRVVPCSHQDGKARYPGNEEDATPRVAWWRNNLTALSQYRNLLFIAYLDKVHVFIPMFPTQELPSKPELILDLPVSGPDLRGYNDPSNPHAVTHLIVGDIGSEEVLVASCDDGDVIAYTTRSIDLVLEVAKKRTTADQTVPVVSGKLRFGRERRPFPGDHESPDISCSPVVEPWLLHNVGLSAWGLATHKFQRLLAVSSNTLKISVFVFSLDRSEGFGEADGLVNSAHMKVEIYDQLRYDPRIVSHRWKSGSANGMKSRYRDFKIDLDQHKDNIPSISFYDSDRLGEGTYLASTDIKGNTCIWDVWNGKVVLQKHGSLLYSAVGWGVACLDPKASRCTEGQIETFGCKGQIDDRHTIVDISEGTQLVADNSQWHPGFSNFGSVPAPNPSVEAILLQPATASDIDMDGSFEFDVIDDDLDEDALEGSDSTEPEEDGEVGHMHEGFTTPVDESDGMVSYIPTYAGLPIGAVNPFAFSDLAHLNDPSQAPLRTQEAAQQSVDKTVRNWSGTARPQRCKLPFNLLQTSEADIHLFRNLSYYSEHTEINESHAQVVCQQAIHQTIPPGLHHLSRTERLNMILQIPELGVVAIGNQAGRVGILTMTRWQAQRQSGYKIECILPSKSQEEEGLRPKLPLMGIAVGPIQGHETKPDAGSTMDAPDNCIARPRVAKGASRRFRLIMVYCDHTVLSYEISRPNEGEEMLVV